MSVEIYFCPDHPLEHLDFVATYSVMQDWLIDCDGGFLETLDSCAEVIDGPQTINCASCGNSARFGRPPSALEQIAKQAEDG